LYLSYILKDEARDPLTQGYQRVNTTDNAPGRDGAGLQSVVHDTNADDLTTTPRIQEQRAFSPVLPNEKNPFIQEPQKIKETKVMLSCHFYMWKMVKMNRFS
jgi:hypothetical protein